MFLSTSSVPVDPSCLIIIMARKTLKVVAEVTPLNVERVVTLVVTAETIFVVYLVGQDTIVVIRISWPGAKRVQNAREKIILPPFIERRVAK